MTDSQCPRNNTDLSPPFRTRSAEGLVGGPPFQGNGSERDTWSSSLAMCNENAGPRAHDRSNDHSMQKESNHVDQNRHIETNQSRETMHVHAHHGRDTSVNAPPVDAMSLHDNHDDDSLRAVHGGRRGELGRSALDATVVD